MEIWYPGIALVQLVSKQPWKFQVLLSLNNTIYLWLVMLVWIQNNWSLGQRLSGYVTNWIHTHLRIVINPWVHQTSIYFATFRSRWTFFGQLYNSWTHNETSNAQISRWLLLWPAVMFLSWGFLGWCCSSASLLQTAGATGALLVFPSVFGSFSSCLCGTGFWEGLDHVEEMRGRGIIEVMIWIPNNRSLGPRIEQLC